MQAKVVMLANGMPVSPGPRWEGTPEEFEELVREWDKQISELPKETKEEQRRRILADPNTTICKLSERYCRRMHSSENTLSKEID